MGVPGTNGRDGEDGVSVTDAKIDFDGSLVISLSSGREINVGEVVAPDLAEKIKVITNGGGTSQVVLDTLASLQAQITAISNFGYVNYVGTWNANTNSPTITSGSGDKGDYYVVSVAGFTNIDGQTLWGVGDWIIFNGAVWQKVDGGSTGDFTNISVNTMATFTYLDDDKAVFTNSSAELVSKAVTGTGNVVLSASPTLTGTINAAGLTTSSTVTHNGGTANGVAYLNGSKVLTTGSALTFSSSTLGVSDGSVTAGNTGVVLTGKYASGFPTSGAGYFQLQTNNSDGTNGGLSVFTLAGGTLRASYRIVDESNAGGCFQAWNVAGSEQMRLNSTGLVVGGTSAVYTNANRGNISINGASTALLGLSTGGTGRAYLYTDGSRLDLLNTQNDALTFGTNNTERARIDSSGNLLVGAVNNFGTGGVGVAILPSQSGVRVASAATTNAAETFSMYSTGTSSYRFYVDWSGKVNAVNTTIAAISDQRLKENVRDLDDGLSAIMALKPRKFDWKAGKGKDIKDDRGFIAQEFEQVFPEMIDNWKDPAPEGEEPYKSVRADLIPILVKAIQELKAEFDAYKAAHP
jgi:hypothetical protein